MGYLLRRQIKIDRKILILITIISLFLFIFIPSNVNDQIIYVTGYYKILFSFIVFSFVLFATFYGNLKQNFITKTLNFFGEISYSVYLIHPVVYYFFIQVLHIQNIKLHILISFITTILISTLVYKFVENPLIQIGRKINNIFKRNNSIIKSKVNQTL